jgi:hypothetical protein
LIGLLLVPHKYKAAKDWKMIKKGGVEFATFSNQWKAKASFLDQ